MEKSLKCAILLIFLTVSFSVHGSDIDSWWNDLDKLNGLRVSIKIGGWNFWYKNDADYVYSDKIGSYFLGTKEQLYCYPMIGAGVRWSPPKWKFLLFNGVFSTGRISLGAGVGFPVGKADFNITPWAAVDITFTNRIFPAYSFESGVDILIKWFIIGLDFCSSSDQPFDNNMGWKSINYGVSLGFKIL